MYHETVNFGRLLTMDVANLQKQIVGACRPVTKGTAGYDFQLKVSALDYCDGIRNIKSASDVAALAAKGCRAEIVMFVREVPSTLAAGANTVDDTYSLARLIASQPTRGTPQDTLAAAIAAAQRALAEAKRRNLTVTQWLIASKFHYANGKYGEAFGRLSKESTAADPCTWHLDVAQAVLDGIALTLPAPTTSRVGARVWPWVLLGVGAAGLVAVVVRKTRVRRRA